MRSPGFFAAALLVGACVRPTPPGPAVWEEAVIGVRDDGAFLVAEASLAPRPEGVFLLVRPGEASRTIAPIEPAIVAKALAETSRDEPTGLRAEILGDSRTTALLAAQGMTLASPLAPVPSSGRHRFAFPEHELALWLVPTEDALFVRAFDASSTVTLAETARLKTAWISGVYRAGERVAVVAGSSSGAEHRVQAATLVDLRRADAMLRHEAGSSAYRMGRLDEAIAAFRRASEADPTWADAPYDEACALMLDNRPKEAAARLERALQLDPVRVRALAGDDRDLLPLRQLPAIRERLGLPAPRVR